MIMKEAELTRAEESITQEQQLIQEMRQHVCGTVDLCVCCS